MASLYLICRKTGTGRVTRADVIGADITRQTVWEKFIGALIRYEKLYADDAKELFPRNTAASEMKYEHKDHKVWVQKIRFDDMLSAYAIIISLFPDCSDYWNAKFLEKHYLK